MHSKDIDSRLLDTELIQRAYNADKEMLQKRIDHQEVEIKQLRGKFKFVRTEKEDLKKIT